MASSDVPAVFNSYRAGANRLANVADIDWSKLNQPSGELKNHDVSPTEKLGDTMADILMAAGAKPDVANHLVEGMGGILGLTPLAVPAAAADLINAKNRGDVTGVAQAIAGMIPGEGAGVRLAMDEASRLARAASMGFRTKMPLYHGSDVTFDAFRSVPTSADGWVSPGVSTALDPEIANEFAAARRDNAQASPQVHKLFHRTDNPALLTLSGDETHPQVVATLRDAFDRGHDAVMLRNYTSPGGKTGDIIIVKDANQLRSPQAAFDPLRRESAHLLAGLGGIGLLAPELFDGQQDH